MGKSVNEVQSIEEIYSDILKGRRESFPRGTWMPANGGFDNFKRCFRWLINQELKYDREKIIDVYGLTFLFDYKLQGAYARLLRGKSTYDIVNTCFPEHGFKPWEFHVPVGYWDDDENIREALHWFLHEHLNYRYEDLVFLTYDKIANTKFARVVNTRFDCKIGNMLEFLYPTGDWTIKIHERKNKVVSEKMSKYFKERNRNAIGQFE